MRALERFSNRGRNNREGARAVPERVRGFVVRFVVRTDAAPEHEGPRISAEPLRVSVELKGIEPSASRVRFCSGGMMSGS